jgi:hypothetical protein
MGTIPKTESFSELLLGGMSFSLWLFYALLIFMGAFIFVAKRVGTRKNKNTNFSFTLWFANANNILAIPFSIILGYIVIRFYSDYQGALQNWLPKGISASPFAAALLFGFYLHKISEKIGIKVNKMTQK